MAQVSAYNEKYHVDWAWSLALKGATDEEIAEAFHISVRTLHRWKKTHPELLTALEEGKDVADAKVKRSLYQRAVGYEAKEVTQIIEQDPATGTQRVSKTQVTTKHIVPDTMACMYWLNNRSKGEFSQRQEVTLGGSVRTSPMEKLTEDELRSLARLDEEPDAEK
mgnify:FL=1